MTKKNSSKNLPKSQKNIDNIQANFGKQIIDPKSNKKGAYKKILEKISTKIIQDPNETMDESTKISSKTPKKHSQLNKKSIPTQDSQNVEDETQQIIQPVQTVSQTISSTDLLNEQ